MALFSPRRTVQGRQSIQLGEYAFPNLSSVKAMLFVHISLERKELVICNNVFCIMQTYVSMCIIHCGMALCHLHRYLDNQAIDYMSQYVD